MALNFVGSLCGIPYSIMLIKESGLEKGMPLLALSSWTCVFLTMIILIVYIRQGTEDPPPCNCGCESCEACGRKGADRPPADHNNRHRSSSSNRNVVIFQRPHNMSPQPTRCQDIDEILIGDTGMSAAPLLSRDSTYSMLPSTASIPIPIDNTGSSTFASPRLRKNMTFGGFDHGNDELNLTVVYAGPLEDIPGDGLEE